MTWNWLAIAFFILGVSLASTSLLVIYRIASRRRRINFHDREMLMRQREEVAYRKFLLEQDYLAVKKSESKTIEMIIRDKKQRFSSVTGVSFHFVDKAEVEAFYNDTFREPTLESLISEITGEISAEAKAGLPRVLESKLGGRDISKWVSTLKLPETSLAGMFVKYQKEVISKGGVTLGLEELDIELKELKEFDASIKNLNEAYDFAIEQAVVENHRTALREKAAEKTLAKLESAANWVLIEGRFLITKNENLYTCTLRHPVNEFLPEAAVPLTISILLPENAIEPRYSGNYAQSVGKLIPLRVFGKVWQPVDRNARVWELQITPLAVY